MAAGDTFLGAVVAVTLVKLLLRLKAAAAATGAPPVKDVRRRSAECMLALVAMLRFDEVKAAGSALALDKDARDRIATCFAMLHNPDREVVQVRPASSFAHNFIRLLASCAAYGRARALAELASSCTFVLGGSRPS